MVFSKPLDLKKMIKLQKLNVTKAAATLGSIKARRKHLSEERDALLALIERNYIAASIFISPSLLMKRLSENAAEHENLTYDADIQTRTLLQHRRRLELLQNRLKDTCSEIERKELSQIIGEFVGGSSFR